MNPKWKKPRAKKGKGAKKGTALIKAVAKQVVASALEDKYNISIAQSSGLPIYFNAGINTNLEVYPLLPKIVLGTDSFNRVGDKIRPKKFMVSVVITANGNYTSSQINQVRLFMLEDKSIRDTLALQQVLATQPGTPIGSQLLRTGDIGGGTSGFAGYPSQIMLRVNRERYTVFHDRVLECLSGQGQTPQSSNGYVGNQTFVSGEQCWKLTFTIPTPAVLKYSQTISPYPTNFAPFLCLGYVQPDGNALPDNLLTRVACNWVSHLDYEDA